MAATNGSSHTATQTGDLELTLDLFTVDGGSLYNQTTHRGHDGAVFIYLYHQRRRLLPLTSVDLLTWAR